MQITDIDRYRFDTDWACEGEWFITVSYCALVDAIVAPLCTTWPLLSAPVKANSNLTRDVIDNFTDRPSPIAVSNKFIVDG